LAHGDRVDAADLFDLTSATAMLRGSVIHAWFEQVRWADDPIPQDDALLRMGRRIAPQAGDDWLSAQLDAFRRMLAHRGVVAALSRPEAGLNEHLDLWLERAFAVRLGGQMVTGQFDRVVVAYGPDGKARWARLIDFKTDHVDPSLFDQLAERYRPQIDTYRRALRRMLDLAEGSVQAGLLLVQAGKWLGCG